MTRSIRPGTGCGVFSALLFAALAGCGSGGSGNCTRVAGGTPPAVDEVTGLQFSTATTIPSNPAPAVQVTVTDVAKAQDAYQATLALPVFPPGVYNCPADFGVTYQLSFLLANGSNLTVTENPSGCSVANIPGTCVRSVGPTYWSQLAQDLGIPEAEIDPYPANVGGDASAQDGATSDARGCLGSAPLCASGTAGGECGDWLTDAQCAGSTWKCPTGTIVASLCGCFDWQPTCSPGTAGGACGSETVSPICAGGHWSCPDGTVSSDDCACVLSGDGGAASDGGCP